MRLHELLEKLNDLVDEYAVSDAPFDPEIIIKSDHPWKFLRKVEMDKVATVEAVKNVIALK